jgi:hypothetical protein
VTYELMAMYWPTAAERPDATGHDINHTRWVNSVPKLVFSRMLAAARLIKDDVAAAMPAIEQQPGRGPADDRQRGAGAGLHAPRHAGVTRISCSSDDVPAHEVC